MMRATRQRWADLLAKVIAGARSAALELQPQDWPYDACEPILRCYWGGSWLVQGARATGSVEKSPSALKWA
eukprot:2563242-Alexandrium_andersonii.AAC.1